MAKVEGREKLKRKLLRLPEEARKAIRAAMEKSADELVAMMKRLVPVDEGDLRDSIGWTWGAAPKGSFAVESVGSGDLKLTIYAGSEKAFYVRFIEFGVAAQSAGTRVTNRSGRERRSLRTTSGQAAQPFFFPSYRALRRRIKSRIARAVRESIRKVAAA